MLVPNPDPACLGLLCALLSLVSPPDNQDPYTIAEIHGTLQIPQAGKVTTRLASSILVFID